ncbi:MAG: DUF192 domain-containing protein [Aquabacterium sp.]|nr:MAG: DUF192 domain-containing protein [Aquabacterium sp.]
MRINSIPSATAAVRGLRHMLLVLACAAGAVHAQGTGQPQNLPVVKLGAGMYVIQAQVASTAQQREIGLMYRDSMPQNEGMLFVFEQASTQCFWMKNTLLPLSIAFVAEDGSIVNVDEMQPQTLNEHCSAKPVAYVLEMNKGWFAKHGLKAGSRLTGPMFPSARK